MKTLWPLMLLTVWLLVGCREQPTERMQKLFSLAETYPDSVQGILPQIGQDRLTNEADKSLWYLTWIKAKDKSYKSITSDSIILDVVEYYENHKNDSLLPEAYYYAGRFYAERKDLSRAIECFYKCDESITNKKRLLKLQCVLNSQIGYVLRDQLISTEALPYFKKSLFLSKSIKDSCGMAYSLRDIGVTYGFCGEEDSALVYCLKAYQLAKKTGDQKLFIGMSTQVARCYNEMGRFAEGEPYITYALNHISKERERTIYTNAVATFIGLKQYDKAKIYLYELQRLPNMKTSDIVPQHLSYIAVKQGDLRLASKYMDDFLENYDIARQEREQEAAAVAKAAHDFSVVEKEKDRIERVNLLQKGGLIVLFLFLMAGGCCVFAYTSAVRQKRKFLRLKLQAYKSRLVSVEQEKCTNGHIANQTRLKEEYFSDAEKRHLTEEQWQEFMLNFRRAFPNFEIQVMELCKMDDHAFRICMLIKIGLSPTDIARIMCISTSAISNQRKRLYYRAFGKNGNPNDWDEIIRKL